MISIVGNINLLVLQLAIGNLSLADFRRKKVKLFRLSLRIKVN